MAKNRPADGIVVALAGQPNCGKSTIFNAVAGFKVNTANFPGTTVSYTETRVLFGGKTIRLIDLPGTYSISSYDLAEKTARDFLLSGKTDVIINVTDAALLSRSLEFTIQLMEMGIPMVVGLNMMDEAHRKGITVDTGKLARLTGVPTNAVIAVQGQGIDDLFKEALRLADGGYAPVKPTYDRDVETCIADIREHYPGTFHTLFPIDERFVVIRLLEMDADFENQASLADPAFMHFVAEQRHALAEMHGWPETGVFASHRHALVLDLYEKISTLRHRSRTSFREQVDRLIFNPVGGLAVMLGSFLLLFYLSFWLGDTVSGLLAGPFGWLRAVAHQLGSGFVGAMVVGIEQGFEAGAGIVLPYLVPLLFMIALYEDTGLLPRIAFMMDGLLHHVGLHGKSAIPIVLGYGCNVPAIMATKNLENADERTLALLIIPFIACSARTVIILALAGKFLGAAWTTLIYLGNIAVAFSLSFILSRFFVDQSPGIIMDVPPLRRPHLRILLKKVWLQLYGFLTLAWPVLVVASVILALLARLGVDEVINRVLSPLTSVVLRLPEKTGIVLFLGVFRKELTLLMLSSALGSQDISTALSHPQILVLVVFTVLYVPCVATLATLWKEGGVKVCLLSAALNLSVALLVAGLVAQLMRLA